MSKLITIAMLAVAASALLYSARIVYDYRAAYIEACTLMGGEPIIGKMYTKACIKNEYLVQHIQ